MQHKAVAGSQSWTTDLVEDRLVEALRVVARQPNPLAILNSLRSAWPRTLTTFADAVARVDTTPTSPPPYRPAPSQAQVTRMEQAILWPTRYLAEQQSWRMSVLVRASCIAYHRRVTVECARRGIKRRTLYAHAAKGLRAIADGLSRDRVPVEPADLYG